MRSRRLRLGLLLALACAIATPSSAQAATYRFEVAKFTMRQLVSWHYVFRDRHCESQSDLDYYEHTGSGQGILSGAPPRRGRVTFRTRRGAFLPARIAGKPYVDQVNSARGLPVAFGNDATWTVAFRDDPGADCVPPAQLGTPDRPTCSTGGGAEDALETGMLAGHLLLQNGRVRLSGGVYADEPEKRCADPSAITGAASHAVPTRRNVDRLIRKRSVKRIVLSAAAKGTIPAQDLAPPGAAFDVLGGEGAKYDVRWSMTLVRLRSR